jgi:RHS repeat-associated protein
MNYYARDTRGLADRAWKVGYRWSHNYEIHIRKEQDGITYKLLNGVNTGPAFTYDGTTFSESADQSDIGVNFGQYHIEFQDATNIVARRKTWSDMGQSGAYHAWHVGEGFVFTLDPNDSNNYLLTKIIGSDGNALKVYYDANSWITSIVTAASNAFNFIYYPYDFGDRIAGITDVTGGRTASFAHMGDQLYSVSDMAGQTFTFAYDDPDGRMTSLRRPNAAGGYDQTTIATGFGGYGQTFNVHVVYPEGNTISVSWYSPYMTIFDGKGSLSDHFAVFSWGQGIDANTDPLGRTTSYDWRDTESVGVNANAINWGRQHRIVSKDGTSNEYLYDAYGNTTNVLHYDASANLMRKDIAYYAYFSGTTSVGGTNCLSSVTNEAQDANGNVLSRSATEWAYSDNGTTDILDDVYTLVSEKNWISADATNYTETKYVYYTNTWLLSAVQVLVSGTNTYRTIKTFTYDSNWRIASVADALTNTTYLSYDSVGRVITNAYSGYGSSITNVTKYFYDNLDRQTNVVYPDNTTESWTYTPGGSGVRTHTDQGGDITSYSYNGNKWLTNQTTVTVNGTLLSRVVYQYDGAGNITNTIDAMGNNHASIYNAASELSTDIDSQGNPTSYYYDGNGRQYMTVYTDGSISSNTYDSASRVIQTARYASSAASSPLTTASFGYDPLDRVVTNMDALGHITVNTFDMLRRSLKTINLTLGTYTESQYDLQGNVTKQIGPVGMNATAQAIADATVNNSYDALNRLISRTDPECRTTTYIYSRDWPNQVAQVLDDNSQVVLQNYYDNSTGRLLTNILNGVRTVYEYNALGDVTKTTFPDGSYSRNIYDGSRLLSQVSRTGNTNSFAYDLDGRIVAVTNSMGEVTQYRFDALGNVTNMIDALTNSTVYAYDAMNRLTVTTRPDGLASTNAWDALGRLISKTGAGSVPVSYEYNAVGQMTKLVDGETNQTEFVYDCCHLTEKVYPDNSSYSYSYNDRGWLDVRIDAKGATTLYSYNKVGQLTNVHYTADAAVNCFYDNLGRMTRRVDAAGTSAWTYDGESTRMLTEATPFSQTVTYTYHTDTYELASVSLDATNKTEYYWYQGRLTNVVGRTVSLAPLPFAYSYKPNSDLLQQTVYLGGTVTVYRAWDPDDRLLAITATNAQGQAINDCQYTLDSMGRRTKHTNADASYMNYGYDSYDQLVSAIRTNSANPAADAAYSYVYDYDLVGNRIHENRGQLGLAGVFNDLNQLTQLAFTNKVDVYGIIAGTNPPYTAQVAGTNAVLYNTTNFIGGATLATGSNNISVVVADAGTNTNGTVFAVYAPLSNPELFVYDANGNLTSDAYHNYAWDEENRLTAIETRANYPGLERRKSEFVYDDMGRRAQRTDYSSWNGTLYTATNITRFVWDGWNLLAELASDNSVISYHCWGQDLSGTLQGAGGIAGLLCRTQGGTNYLYTYDGNGNVVDVLTSAGATLAHYDYDPFGRTFSQTGSFASSNPWRFSTKMYEDEWRLYYYGHRFYSPNLHTFPNRDPIGKEDVRFLYEFAGNNSICNVDNLGLSTLKRDKGNITKKNCGDFSTSENLSVDGITVTTGWIIQHTVLKHKITKQCTKFSGTSTGKAQCDCCTDVNNPQWTTDSDFYEAFKISKIGDVSTGANSTVKTDTSNALEFDYQNGEEELRKTAVWYGAMTEENGHPKGYNVGKVGGKDPTGTGSTPWSSTGPTADSWSAFVSISGMSVSYGYSSTFNCCPSTQQSTVSRLD